MQLDEFACGHYRLKYPLETLKEKGHNVRIELAGANNYRIDHLDLSQYTHIICQRQFYPWIMQPVLEAKKRYGTVVLYEVDDNLHAVHPESHAYQVFKPGGEPLKLFDRWVKASDGLIVTTPDLAGQYTRLNPRVFVVQNYIDFHIRDWDTPVERDPRLVGKIAVGWAGGSTHQEDDAPVREVLTQILRDYDNVVLALCTHPRLMAAMGAKVEKQWGLAKQKLGALDVPEDKVVHLTPVQFDQYAVIPAQFDIGIAPLRDTPFNRNKSWLKIMEYGARGVPYVASDIAPYRRFHKETNGVGGFLAAGKSDWDIALRHLIENPEATRRRGEEFSKLTRERYSLRGNIDQWETILEQSLDRNSVRVWEKTEAPGRNDPCPCGSEKKYKKCCIPAFG